MKLTIFDYGGGNLKSVINMLNSFAFDYVVTDDPKEIEKSEKLIFPGQGHFGQVMKALEQKRLADALKTALDKGTPFLGICVGLQVLFESSEEAPDVKGLGIFKGKNVRFKEGKIPQIGWNKIKTTPSNTFFCNDFFYFVNSYHVVPENQEIVSSTASYHIDFTASVEYKNITATQFHPEKSGTIGQQMIKNWIQNA